MNDTDAHEGVNLMTHLDDQLTSSARNVPSILAGDEDFDYIEFTTGIPGEKPFCLVIQTTDGLFHVVSKDHCEFSERHNALVVSVLDLTS